MAALFLDNLTIQTIKPVNLSIAESECISISGESGSGKSLLLRAIADIDQHSGHASIGQQARESMSGPQWRKKVGLLPAQIAWWHGTVGEHFNTSEPRYLTELGFGPDTLSWSINRLSTGENQRLGLLRLLECSPQVLLLDEPTASLDNNNKQALEQLVKHYQAQENAAVIWVSHDQEQCQRVANRQFVLAAGELKEVI